MMKLNNKGFTLIEVLAVVVILSVVSGIAVNGVLSSIRNSKNSSYNLMINNIVTASGLLYEEVENINIVGSNNSLYVYDSNGIKSDDIIKINDKKITVTLQTLVSNGFLTGSNNDCSGNSCDNVNRKIIRDPNTDKDIGNCKIIISRDDNKYKVEAFQTDNSLGELCPSSYS